MREESKTPDLVELTRCSFQAGDRRDFDAFMSFIAPDAVWDMSPMDRNYRTPTARAQLALGFA